MAKSKKYRGKTGYALQAARVLATPRSEIVRTIKYPLTGNETYLHTLKKAIEHDARYVRGVDNLDNFLNDKPVYTLTDFWLDTLRAGCFFQPKTADLAAIIRHLEKRPSAEDIVFETLPKDLRKLFQKEEFIEVFLRNSGFRKSSTPASLFRRFKQTLTDSGLENQKLLDTLEKLSKKLIGTPISEQKKVIYKVFGLKKSATNLTVLNLTFFPHPNLPLAPSLSPIDAISRLELLMKEASIPEKKIKNGIGLDETGNCLSNYLGGTLRILQQKNSPEIRNEFVKLSTLWKGKEAELQKRLDFLCTKAELLPPQPKLTASWSDYRSRLIGQLKSWYANYQNRLQQLQEQLPKIVEDLRTLQEKADKTKFPEFTNNLQTALTLAQKLIGNLSKDTISDTDMDLFTQLLAQIRLEANRLYQNNHLNLPLNKNQQKTAKKKPQSEDSEDINTVNKALPDLYKPVKKIPQFYGESRKDLLYKFIKTPAIFEQYWQFFLSLESIIESLPDMETIEEQYLLRQLDQLTTLKNKANSNLFSQTIEQIVHEYTNEKPDERHRFYINPHQRQKIYQLKLEKTPAEDSTTLKTWRQQTKVSRNWKKMTAEQRLDMVEIEKTRFAWLNKHKHFITTTIQAKPEYPEKVNAYLSLKNGLLTPADISYVSQAILFSELRGLASRLSLQQTKVRNNINPIGSEKKFILTSHASKTDQKGKYGILIKGEEHKKEITSVPQEVFQNTQKNVITAPLPMKEVSDPVLSISTSHYQTQFLDWLMGQLPKSKQGLSISRTEPSLTVETTLKLKWDLDKGNASVAPEHSSLYFVQPFKIAHQALEAKEPKPIINNRYLGLDIGEYGIAYAVIDVDKQKVSPLIQGFIYARGIKHIRDYVGSLKQQQTLGTFTMPSTKLQRLREDVSHSLRNRIHDLALRYRAQLVYEGSISAFESGSNRVTNLYHTIKKSDIYAEIEAEDALKKAIWGVSKKVFAKQIHAYATSQTCSKCRRSFIEPVSANNSNLINVTKVGQSILKVTKGPYEGAHLYWPSTLTDISDLSYQQCKQGVNSFMRPPLDSAVVKWLRLDHLKDFLKNRGNSALFVCPYCLHVSDADVQAAVNIAFKGHLAELKKQDNQQRDFFQELKKLHAFPVIQLNQTENKSITI